MKRLIDELSPGLEVDLLHAADGEAPSAEARTRALGAALGALTATTAGAAAASAKAASTAPSLAGGTALGAAKSGATLWIAKTLVAVSLGGLAVGGSLYGVRSLRTEAPAPSVVVSPPQVNTAEARPIVTPLPVEGEPASPTELPVRPKPKSLEPARVPVEAASPPAAQPLRTASLGEQIRLIDAARAALGRSEAPAAIAALEAYRSQWPQGAFAMEADLLQIEALLAAGKRPEAVVLARRLAGANPGAAYRARLAPLLEP